MKIEFDPKKALVISLTVLVLLFAVWLVSPYFTIDKSDANAGKITSYRLFIGLTIMIGFVGKSLWDVLAPQGLAKKVSNAKAVAIVVLAMVITGFVIFTVARAAAYYLDASIAADSANFLP
jgi:quinol-cytochrome oxidoreductase complex cytochrome b subunit